MSAEKRANKLEINIYKKIIPGNIPKNIVAYADSVNSDLIIKGIGVETKYQNFYLEVWLSILQEVLIVKY